MIMILRLHRGSVEKNIRVKINKKTFILKDGDKYSSELVARF